MKALKKKEKSLDDIEVPAVIEESNDNEKLIERKRMALRSKET